MKVEVEKFKQALEDATETIKQAQDVISSKGLQAAAGFLPTAQRQFAQFEAFSDPKTLTASIKAESPEDQDEVRNAIVSFFARIDDVKRAAPLVASLLENQGNWFDNLELVKQSLEEKSKKVGPAEESSAT